MVGVTISTLVKTGPKSVSAVLIELAMPVDDLDADTVSEPMVEEGVREMVTTEWVLLETEEPQTARQEPRGEASLK